MYELRCCTHTVHFFVVATRFDFRDSKNWRSTVYETIDYFFWVRVLFDKNWVLFVVCVSSLSEWQLRSRSCEQAAAHALVFVHARRGRTHASSHGAGARRRRVPRGDRGSVRVQDRRRNARRREWCCKYNVVVDNNIGVVVVVVNFNDNNDFNDSDANINYFDGGIDVVDQWRWYYQFGYDVAWMASAWAALRNRSARIGARRTIGKKFIRFWFQCCFFFVFLFLNMCIIFKK